MKKQRYIVEIEMPDGDMVSSERLRELIQQDCDVEDDGRQKVFVKETSLSSNLDEAAKRIAYDVCKQLPNGEEKDGIVYYAILAAIAGAEWMNEQMKMPNSTKLISEWHNVKTILEEKDFRRDEWRLAYNAFMFGFSRGINTQKTEK